MYFYVLFLYLVLFIICLSNFKRSLIKYSIIKFLYGKAMIGGMALYHKYWFHA